MFGLLTRHMQSIGLLLQKPSAPYSSLTYRGLVEAVRSFPPPEFHGPEDCFNMHHACVDSSFQSIIEGVEADIEGLDLTALDFTRTLGGYNFGPKCYWGWRGGWR